MKHDGLVPHIGATVDVLVVGGGLAGLTAALRCAQQDATVVVLEKGSDPHYPCNTRYSGGIYHLCRNFMSLPPKQLAEMIAQTTDGTVEKDLAEAMANDAERSIAWLRDQGIRFIKASIDFDGIVVAPPRPVRTGVLWEKGRGGDVLLGTLQDKLRALGQELKLGVRATHLRMQNGKCVGVQAETADGPLEFDCRAVVLADGGYQSNAEFTSTHISPHAASLYQRNAGTGTGDGLRMALDVGADSKGLDHGFYGHLLSLDVLKNDALWPFPTIDGVACAGIVVDGQGRRMADEGLGGVYVTNVVARSHNPQGAIAIFDDTIWNAAGKALGVTTNPWLERTGGTVFRAASLRALAPQIGVDPAALEQTVADYNNAIAANRAAQLTPARTVTAKGVRPIADAPFGAIKLLPGMTYTFGGISIDVDGRVRTPAGATIPGLYAAGSTTGGLEGGPRFGYVGGLAKATIFGLRAAEHIASKVLRPRVEA